MFAGFSGHGNSIQNIIPLLKKENVHLKIEFESLLIASQNNTSSTSYMIMKIDNTQHNGRNWLCEEKDESVNHIIS